MVNLKITLYGSIADVKVHIIGEKLHPDFWMSIDLQKRRIINTDATGIQEWFTNKILWGLLRRYDHGEDIENCTCIAWY